MSSEPNNTPSSSAHDELAHHLGELGFGGAAGSAACDPCRVERVLKQSPVEVTQLVWLRLAGGRELGPYVRKLIDKDSGVGTEWQELWRAQQAGARFSGLPRVVYCGECRSRGEWQGHAEQRYHGEQRYGGERPSDLCVLMEYVPGPTLRELVEQTPASGKEELAARIMPSLCAAVRELHEGFPAPIIHRDITPSNVICAGTRHDEAVLVDLGIARTWKPEAEADTTHFGTRAYAAPEQFGFGQTDVRSDVYALGLVAFFCLVGRDPTAADRERGFAAPEVPEAWRRVIAKAASFDPNERYATVRELQQALPGAESSVAASPGAGEQRGPAENGDAEARASMWPRAPRGASGLGASERTASGGAGGWGDGGANDTSNDGSAARGSSNTAALASAGARRSHRGLSALLGKAWQARNIVVIPVLAILLIASSTCPFQPGFRSSNPFWLDLFGYLVYMNYALLGLGYLLMNKRWLHAHVPFFKKRTPKEVLKIIAVGFVALTVVLFALVV